MQRMRKISPKTKAMLIIIANEMESFDMNLHFNAVIYTNQNTNINQFCVYYGAFLYKETQS